jgi:hypothetical protein
LCGRLIEIAYETPRTYDLVHAKYRLSQFRTRGTGAAAPHPLHQGREIDVELVSYDAQTAGALQLANRARGSDERLGRNTARVQTIAAQKMTLDERHAGAQARRANGADESCSASAKHNEIVRRGRNGVQPARGVNVVHELDIGAVKESLNVRQVHHGHNSRNAVSIA